MALVVLVTCCACSNQVLTLMLCQLGESIGLKAAWKTTWARILIHLTHTFLTWISFRTLSTNMWPGPCICKAAIDTTVSVPHTIKVPAYMCEFTPGSSVSCVHQQTKICGLCKSVHPWGRVSEIQSIKETKICRTKLQLLLRRLP